MDPAAGDDVLRRAGARLGIALAPVVAALDLAEIVLSGPSELLDGVLSSSAVETVRARTLREHQGNFVVRMTELGDDIVLRGAAVMVLSGQLGVS
jgi:predicted NBD/HSP70 family sugar kinase